MIRTASLAAALANRRKLILPNGTGYWRSEFITSAPDASVGPQAFLVEQDPLRVILPHFHLQNEFQVVVDGSGMFGRHLVRPLTLHYAGAHTGYGPISAGPGGLSYLTLRARMDPGAKFLPEARPEMDMRAPKRHLFGAADLSDEASVATRTAATIDAVVAPQPDGIGAWLVRLHPESRAEAPAHAGGGGRFYVVLRGALRWNGEALGRFGHVFASADERLPVLAAGDSGAEVLVVQFPGGAITA